MTVGIAIEGIRFGYGATPVLDDVTLTVAPGEFFAFLGPSGSGKTTLLRLIAGFGRPASGRILVGGEDITAHPPWRRDVGMVFQSYALWPHMTVARNVAFGLEQRKVPRAEIRRRVGEALERVGLAPLAQRRPAQLSGGQQQRVALARTLVVAPRVLLLDEPLSNLDAKLRVDMRHELKTLQRQLGITTIYVTHDQEEANAVADRMALLDAGRVQQVGPPLDLYDRPANRFVAAFLGSANLIEGSIDATGAFHAADLVIPGVGGAAGARAVSVRPQDVTVEPQPGGAARIMAREFLGHLIRYRIALGGLTLSADCPHHRGAVPLETGAAVALTIDPDRVAVLR